MLKYHESDGIIVSEVGVSQLIYFADTHSYDKVNCLYTFPKIFYIIKLCICGTSKSNLS